MMELGVRAFLPLHLEPVHSHGFDRRPQLHITPLFRGYLFGRWGPADDWRRLLRGRGIGGIISDPATERPVPLPDGAVEELLGRTSTRRIVDDPGCDPPLVAAERQHWADMTNLSAKARGELLLRLFGREDVAA